MGCDTAPPSYGPGNSPQAANSAPVECITPPTHIGWFALTVGAASDVIQSTSIQVTLYPKANRAYIKLTGNTPALGDVRINLSLMDAPVGTTGALAPRDIAASISASALGLTHCGQAGSSVVLTKHDGAHIAGSFRGRLVCPSPSGETHLTLSGGFHGVSTQPEK